MSERKLKEQVFSGMFWRLLERVCAQGVSFILSIILARILMPDDYGTIALLLIFINIANVFVTNGLGEALVQAKHVEKKDFSTILYCGLFFAVIIYAVLFVTSPYIAVFYGDDKLIWMLRVFALKIPISAFNSVQQAYVQRNMLFRKFFMATLGGTVLSGIIGIIMAYQGYGAWALIVQYLVNSVVDTIVLFFSIDCRPTLEFSMEAARRYIKYGWKLTAGALINIVYEELRSLIIGKKYSSSDLAFYNKGSQFPKLIVSNLNVALNSVLFPAFVTKNHSGEGVKGIMRKSIRVNTYLIFPFMVGIGVIAEPLIELLLTRKWLECVPYLRIMCFYNAYVPIAAIDSQGIKAIGRSDVFLKMTLVRRIIYLMLLLLVMEKGVFAIALTSVVNVVIAFLVNGIFVKKYIGYGLKERIIDLLPQIGLSLIMGVAVYCVGFLHVPAYIKLIVQVLGCVAVYLGLSEVFKLDLYLYLKDFLVNYFRKKAVGRE